MKPGQDLYVSDLYGARSTGERQASLLVSSCPNSAGRGFEDLIEGMGELLPVAGVGSNLRLFHQCLSPLYTSETGQTSSRQGTFKQASGIPGVLCHKLLWLERELI